MFGKVRLSCGIGSPLALGPQQVLGAAAALLVGQHRGIRSSMGCRRCRGQGWDKGYLIGGRGRRASPGSMTKV